MKEGGCCGGGSCGMGGCRCMHHKVPALMVTLFGLLFLGKALNWVTAETVNWAWPVLVLIVGLTKLCRGMCKCCKC